MQKLLKERYKTRDGAVRRAAFENGIAKFEHEHGHKAKLYRYLTKLDSDGIWRVVRVAS